MISKDAGLSSEQKGGPPPNAMRIKKAVHFRNIVVIIGGAVSLVALYLLSRQNYLLFHSIVEIFSIVIAFAIFAIAWNSRHLIDNNYLVFIGVAFLFVAGLDVFHTLAYKGMGVFPTFVGSNLATQLWIATRYVLAFSFLTPLFFTKRKIKPSLIVAGYGLVSAFILASIFYWQNFPVAYDNNSLSLTAFKIGSEYAISIIIIASIGLLIKKRRDFSANIYKFLLVAMVLAVATEMAFTLYTDVYGVANLVGHLLNVLSFYFIYRALIETGLTKPYELLFRNLKQSETKLANHAARINTGKPEARKRNHGTRSNRRSTERKRRTPAIKIGFCALS